MLRSYTLQPDNPFSNQDVVGRLPLRGNYLSGRRKSMEQWMETTRTYDCWWLILRFCLKLPLVAVSGEHTADVQAVRILQPLITMGRFHLNVKALQAVECHSFPVLHSLFSNYTLCWGIVMDLFCICSDLAVSPWCDLTGKHWLSSQCVWSSCSVKHRYFLKPSRVHSELWKDQRQTEEL